MVTTITVSPTRISSPSCRSQEVIRRPPTQVPLVEPRSLTSTQFAP